MVPTPNEGDDDEVDPVRLSANVANFHKTMQEFADNHQELLLKAKDLHDALDKHDLQQKILKHRIDMSETMSKNIRALDMSQVNEMQSIVQTLNNSDLDEQLKPLRNEQLNAIVALREAIENDWEPTLDNFENAAAVSEAHTQPLLNTPISDVQPATPKRGVEDASPEELVQRLVELDVVEVCPECDRPYLAGNMHYVETNEGSTSEHDEVCHNCHGSDIGFQ